MRLHKPLHSSARPFGRNRTARARPGMNSSGATVALVDAVPAFVWQRRRGRAGAAVGVQVDGADFAPYPLPSWAVRDQRDRLACNRVAQVAAQRFAAAGPASLLPRLSAP